MPPRKRRAKKTRLGSDLAEERKQLMEEHLAKLDLRVKADLKLLEEKLNDTISKIDMAYRSAEMTLTKNVREMTVSEFKKLQGDMMNGQDPLQTLSDSVCEKVALIVQKHSSAKKPSAASSKKSAAPLNRNGMSSSLGKTLNEQQKKSGLRKGKKPLHSDSSLVLGKQGAVQQGAANNRPLKDDVFATPASKRRKRTSQIITPKFDLRKPVLASRCRAPRPGETLVSLSGSPLQNPPVTSGDCIVTIGGKVVDLANVSDKQKKNKLKNLQQQIAQLLS